MEVVKIIHVDSIMGISYIDAYILKETAKTVKIRYADQWGYERTLRKSNIHSIGDRKL